MVEVLEKQDVEVGPGLLYSLAMGFASTKTLLVAQRLGLFAALGTSEKTAEEIAQDRGLPSRTTEMLLDACVSIKVCTKKDGRYANAPVAERYLIPGHRNYLGRFLDHFNDLMYPTWAYLEDAVKTGHSQVQRVVGEPTDNYFQAIDRQMEHLRTFMATMEEHSLLEGESLAKAYDFSKHKVLLDVGGGTGSMSVSILEQHPHMKAVVFDRPPVCELAKETIQRFGMTDRIQTEAGDFFKTPLPTGADVALLSTILHNWSPSNAQAILRQIYKALPPGGILLISEQVLNQDKTEPLFASLCSLNMLVMMEGAQEYSQSEFETFLSNTGFRLLETKNTPGGFRQLLVALRP
jgi:3-hydroxy-5-methyl-1-naphthoate 3-O-methyltransferase